ncbi:MAG: hypothetical protein KGO96_03290 [Elusimicrobia bacterium]|nr:hypothetical protein [Elusimicrobiota bacterium]MDE2424917.1 hypothetical protein [Elusimicrobiota bacterium]
MIDPRLAASSLIEEVSFIFGLLKAKGRKRFERVLLLCAGLLLAGAMLASAPKRKLGVLQARLLSVQAIAQSADSFEQARLQFDAAAAVLPGPESKDHFLTDAIVETLRSSGLTSESIQPPEESVEAGLRYQKITVSLQAGFAQLLPWLARVEAHRPYLHISSLDVVKGAGVGTYSVSAGISTIIPLQALAHGD